VVVRRDAQSRRHDVAGVVQAGDRHIQIAIVVGELDSRGASHGLPVIGITLRQIDGGGCHDPRLVIEPAIDRRWRGDTNRVHHFAGLERTLRLVRSERVTLAAGAASPVCATLGMAHASVETNAIRNACLTKKDTMACRG